jgi:hypothetical protein
MEFFATTGEYKNETDWRNPEGGWLRQIIPKGDQLPKYLDEYEKVCIDLNKDLPGYAYNFEEDFFDGRFTMSHKGVHYAETLSCFSDGHGGFSEGHGFWEGALDIDLTQALFPTEALHKVITSGESGACAGQMASVCNLKILPATAGDAAGQAANIVVRPEDTAAANLVEEASCFRRATDSTESLDDTASAAVSSPWRQASLPFIFFETPYKFTHDDPQPRAAPKCFARAEETALGASLNAQSQAPDILETPYKFHDDPQPRAAPKCFARAEETALGASLNAQSQAPDIIVTPYKLTHDDPQPRAAPKCFARAEETALGASLNAQSQAPDEIIWASFHAQDRQCSPHIFVDYFRFCRQEPARLLTTQDSLYLSL